ncbi:MAG: hypothetical protein R3Y63_11960 [Eubacteriales bacterium]
MKKQDSHQEQKGDLTHLEQVRLECRCMMRLTAGGRSVVLELPYRYQDRQAALKALQNKEGAEVRASFLSANKIPNFIVELCLPIPKFTVPLAHLDIFNEMLLECYGLSDFDMNRWERQARMLGIDNFVDLNIVFDSSQLLHDFPDLHSKEDVINHLCSMTGSKEMVPYMERFTYLNTEVGMLMYTARNQEMIALMNRKKFR